MKKVLTAAVLLTLLVSTVSAYTGPWHVQVFIVRANETVLIANVTEQTVNITAWDGPNHILPLLYGPTGEPSPTNIMAGELLDPYQVHAITVKTWLHEPFGTLVVLSEHPVTVRVVETERITRR